MRTSLFSQSLYDLTLFAQQGFLHFCNQSGDGTAGDCGTGDVVDFAAVFGDFVVGGTFQPLELVEKGIGSQFGD